jgi:hypothetical protein
MTLSRPVITASTRLIHATRSFVSGKDHYQQQIAGERQVDQRQSHQDDAIARHICDVPNLGKHFCRKATGSDAPIALPARSPRLPRDTTEIRALYQGLEVAVPGGGTMSPACQIERGHLPAA